MTNAGISISINGLQVATALDRIGRTNYYRIAAAIPELGEALRDEWRSNAAETAGEHGKWYPEAIENHQTGALEQSIAPNPSKRQGAMSFEEGSVNQPPHWDGRRAAETLQPVVKRRLAAILSF